MLIAHVVRVCRLFLEEEGSDIIDWPPRRPGQNAIEHLWDVTFKSICCTSDCPETRLCPGQDLGGDDTIGHLIRSMPGVLMHTNVEATQTTEHHLEKLQ